MKHISLIALAVTLSYACRKQPEIPPAIINEPENITNVSLTFTDSANTSKQFKSSWSDEDGTGGNNPLIDSIILPPNSTYYVKLEILDQTKIPVVMVSDEIVNEGTDHQFFFSSSTNNISFSYADKDTKENPIGLKSTWQTKSSAKGTVRIVLKHQPGVKANAPGDINAGSSDIDLTFPTQIR